MFVLNDELCFSSSPSSGHKASPASPSESRRIRRRRLSLFSLLPTEPASCMIASLLPSVRSSASCSLSSRPLLVSMLPPPATSRSTKLVVVAPNASWTMQNKVHMPSSG